MLVISTLDLPEQATMAHVAHRAGAFPSVSQARKNGWDRPIELGVHRITKRITVEVVDRPLGDADERPKESYRPDLIPGFWSNYEEPKTHLARAIQYPLDARFADRVVNAYMRDFFESRKKVVDTDDPS